MFVEIEKLLERATEVLNRYALLFSAESFPGAIIGSGDFRHVMATVAADVEHQLAEHRALVVSLEQAPAATADSKPWQGID